MPCREDPSSRRAAAETGVWSVGVGHSLGPVGRAQRHVAQDQRKEQEQEGDQEQDSERRQDGWGPQGPRRAGEARIPRFAMEITVARKVEAVFSLNASRIMLRAIPIVRL